MYDAFQASLLERNFKNPGDFIDNIDKNKHLALRIHIELLVPITAHY